MGATWKDWKVNVFGPHVMIFPITNKNVVKNVHSFEQQTKKRYHHVTNYESTTAQDGAFNSDASSSSY